MPETKTITTHDITMSEEMHNFFSTYNIFDYVPYTTRADIHKICRLDDFVAFYTQQRLKTVEDIGLDYTSKKVIERYGYPVRFGKLLKSLYGDKIADSTVEKFVHKWNEYVVNISTVHICIWPFDKIKEAYLYTNYLSSGGTLGNSCMRQKEKQPLLDFYETNKVEIVVLTTKDNKIKGRALLWPKMLFTSLEQKLRLMDRVYLNSDSDIGIFNKFAAEHNFVCRIDTRTFRYKNDKDFSDYIWLCPIKLDGIICTPWADTMRYLYYRDKFLCNDPKAIELFNKQGATLPNIKQVIVLNSINDYIEALDPNIIEEVLTNSNIRKDRAIFSKRYNGYILKERVAYVIRFDDYWNIIYDKEPFHCADESICSTVFSNSRHEKQWFVKKDCFYNKNTDTFIPKKDALIGSNIYTNKILEDLGEQCVFVLQNEYITEFTPVLNLNTGELLIDNPVNRDYLEHVPAKRSLYRVKNTNRKSKSITNYQKYFHTKRGAGWVEKPEILFYEYVETPLKTKKHAGVSCMKEDERDGWYVQKDKPETLQSWWSL